MQLIEAIDRPEELRALFEEYTAMLIENAPEIAAYLALQDLENELIDFNKYAKPQGRLLGAVVDDQLVGCIALRPLNAAQCELKRLYVKPEYRLLGIADVLVDQILHDAKAIGYSEIFLDTMPYLKGAKKLYDKKGFELTEKYLDSPIAHAIYMKKTL